MLANKLKVGVKTPEVFSVEVDLQVPENIDEQMILARNDLEFQNQCFVRGWRIINQEASGARDRISASTHEERKNREKLTIDVQTIVTSFDPTAPAKRAGRPAKPVEVTVDDKMTAAMAAGDVSGLQALLAAAGVKVNFNTEQK